MEKLRVMLAGHAKRVVNLMVLAFAFVQMASADPPMTVYVTTNGNGVGYPTWAEATNSIQTAIDIISNSSASTVWVSNGVYSTGGVTNYPKNGILTNRVAVWKAITVRSANNDPTNTIIVGAKNNGTNGPAAVRCVYLTNGAALIGFTLTNGATLATGLWNNDNYGGGANCSGILSNCIIRGNAAMTAGGGVYQGTLYNCTIDGNSVLLKEGYGGGAYGSTLYNCLLTNNSTDSGSGGGAYYGTLYNCLLTGNLSKFGGGVYGSTLYNCTLTGNSLAYNGGGACEGTLNNCTLAGNSASTHGGGAYNSSLYNCLIISNSAQRGGGASGSILNNCTIISNYASSYGGGVYNSTLYNCLIIGNYAGIASGTGGGARDGILNNCTVVGNSALTEGGGIHNGTGLNCIVYFNSANYNSTVVFTNCCSPGLSGSGNITNDPMFIANGSGYGTNFVMGDYHLVQNSPCINAGANAFVTTNMPTDLDGHHRIDVFSRQADIGCYEYIPAGTMYSIPGF
jgi:hypothetical protein